MVKKILQQIRADKKIIVTPDDYEKHWQDLNLTNKQKINEKGTSKLIYNSDNDIELLAKRFRNGVIVFDDFKALFINKQSEINALRSLVIRRRQRSIDIIITAHGFTEIVPTYLFSFASKIILFKTLDNPARVKERILNFEQVLTTQKRVNEIASKKYHYFEILKLN